MKWIATSSIVAALSMACDRIEPPTTTDPEKPNSVSDAYNAYNTTLPSWSEFSPLLVEEDEPVPGTQRTFNEMVGNRVYTCNAVTHTLTSNPDKIVTFSPDLGALWVGSLLQGRHYLNGLGSLAELPIRERTPITLFVDKLAPGLTRVVENPTAASVQAAISEMINELANSGTVVASDIAFSQRETYSARQSMLAFGMSANFAASAADASFGRERSVEESKVTAQFVQELFTVAMVSPQTPGAMFTSELTEEKIDEQIALGRLGPDNIPVYVAAVTFGRILRFTITSKASADTIQRILNASYEGLVAGGSVSLSNEEKRILQEATIDIVALGGDADATLALIRSGDLREYFSSNAPLQTAVPISYEVHNLGDETNAVFSETTTYNLVDCSKPDVRQLELELHGSAKTSNNPFDCYGCRRSWSSGTRKYTLPAGAYFTRDHDVVALPGGNPSEYSCQVHGYTDYFEIPLDEGKTARVPRSVTYSASVRSPHGAGSTGSITCEFSFEYVRPG